MHLRFSTQHRGSKTYRYVQLVQSYRREDGMPAHRVVANLGALGDLEVDNLKAALTASREGQAVVLPKGSSPKSARKPMVKANLVYLSLAVLRRVWNEDGLASLVRESLEAHGGDEEVASVVEVLALQRCEAPGSKLASVEWFRKTALPELMAMEPGRYNNTRVHRALDVLDEAEGYLQERLPNKLLSRCGAFINLFGDVTDTWFEGHGPEMAKRGRDKEGLYRRRVGIAMLCDQRGLPLRWKTLPGDYDDDKALTDLAAGLAKEDWAAGIPVIMDRSMGRASSVAFLESTGLRFLTAVPADEFGTSGASIPWEAFAGLEPVGSEASFDQDVSDAEAVAAAVGMLRVRRDRWVLDLDVFEKKHKSSSARPVGTSRVVVALRHAQAVRDPGRPISEIAKEKGLCTRSLRNYRLLCRIEGHIQARILGGEADALTIGDLHQIADLHPDAQSDAFERALASRKKALVPRSCHPAAESLHVRGVVHFNPERFVEERRSESARLRDLDQMITQFNAKLCRADCRVSDRVVLRTVDDFLRRNSLAEVFTIQIETAQDGSRRLLPQKNEEAWARHRRFHGFNLFVAHRDLPQTAAELVALYFAKDAVEKDFQLIKSALALRPVRHRTDPKVRAHVTLCVLALLLSRLLERRIKAAGRRRTAASAIDLLDSCHLNLTDHDGDSLYTVTRPTPDQLDLLTALGFQELTDDLNVAQFITPR